MTLLIKNVQILGARQKMPDLAFEAGASATAKEAPADVFVSGNKISAIGSFSRKPADHVIDGRGSSLAPGFIDIHTESDHFLSLFDQPSQEDFLRQGVTTTIGGHDGVSLAPLLSGELELISRWTHPHRKNADWRTVEEYLAVLDRRGIGVNFGTLAGYRTLRRVVLGGEHRKLTAAELSVLLALFARSHKEGARGISFSAEDIFSDSATSKERDALRRAVSDFKGIYAVSFSGAIAVDHRAVRELLREMKDLPATLLFSHIPPGDTRRLLNLIKEHPRAYAAVSPSATRTLPLVSFLPHWAQKHTLPETLEGVRDPWLREKMKKEMLPLDPARVTFVSAPHHRTLVGMTLRECMEMMEIEDPLDALLLAMEAMRCMGAVSYGESGEMDTATWISHPRALIASQSASVRDHHHLSMMPTPEGKTAFTNFLSLAEKEKSFSMESAVRKLTALPASLLGLADRGAIVPGHYADLVGFSGSEIRFVIVNGKVAVREGKIVDARAGRALRTIA